MLRHSRSSAAIKTIWHRVYASRDVGNAAEQISLRQNKQITKADSAEVNAGVSTKLIQVRVTILAIFCIQHEISLHWWPPVVHPWPPQNVMATVVAIGGAAMGSAMVTGGLPWVVSTGNHYFTGGQRCTTG